MATLYSIAVSANSHGPMALLAEAKVAYTNQDMDVMKGATKAPEFVAKNPFHCCPTIEDDGNVIWESNAILRYICNKNGLEQWYPTDAVARAKIDMALDWRQTALYPNIGKAAYPSLGFGKPNKKVEEEGVANLATQFELMASYYLKDGKFLSGSAVPTIADLSVRPALKFLEAIEYPFPQAILDYCARFDAAVASYAELKAPLDGYLGFLAQQKKEKDAKKAEEKKKAAAKKAAKKKEAEKPKEAGRADGKDAKRVKACLKEGGKKGQDICGMSSFGVHYFLTAMDEPKGEYEYLELCMEGANKPVDPEGDDRKGGAGDLAKIFFSAGEKELAMMCHVPKECLDKTTTAEFFAAVLAPLGATATIIDEHFAKCVVPADPEADRFPLKMRDVAIAAGFAYLKAKQLVLDDDSDDDINYADECGVDLNAGAEGDY